MERVQLQTIEKERERGRGRNATKEGAEQGRIDRRKMRKRK